MATDIDKINREAVKYLPDCVTCVRSKGTAQPRSREPAARATEQLERVFADIAGPFQVPSIGGYTYYVPFIDDKTRYTAIFFLRTKDEMYARFLVFYEWAHTQKGTKVKKLRMDNAGENLSDRIKAAFAKRGIQLELTAPNSPHQNGVAERKHRKLANIARSLLEQSRLPLEFWGEAYALANYIDNRLPTKALEGVTPFEAWTGEKPSFANLHLFGCRAEVLIEHDHVRKLEPRTKTVIYLSPNYNGKGARFYDPSTKRISVSRNATFFEQLRPQLYPFTAGKQPTLVPLLPAPATTGDHSPMAGVLPPPDGL
jgi:hypothetical protein